MKPSLRALLILLFTPPIAAPAQLIYDNLFSDEPFDMTGGWSISGFYAQAVAVRFTPWETLNLDSASLALWGNLRPWADGGTVEVMVHANSNDGLPGAVLESTLVDLLEQVRPMPLTHVEFSNTTTLSVDTSYWLAISPRFNAESSWDQVGSGITAYRNRILDWTFQNPGLPEGGMRLYGVPPMTPVPEPATYALAAAVLLFGVTGRSHLRRAS